MVLHWFHLWLWFNEHWYFNNRVCLISSFLINSFFNFFIFIFYLQRKYWIPIFVDFISSKIVQIYYCFSNDWFGSCCFLELNSDVVLIRFILKIEIFIKFKSCFFTAFNLTTEFEDISFIVLDAHFIINFDLVLGFCSSHTVLNFMEE
jgi:hypothetical protein